MSQCLAPIARDPILRIVLTGFMGAGKSTIGALLAAELGWRFVDVDDELVGATGLSVAELFEQFGEPGFRGREEEVIAALLAGQRTVLALGGGALESSATRDRLLRSPGTHVIFLQTPLEVALARCAKQAGGAVRPVLRDHALLATRFRQRQKHYRAAHQTLSTESQAPGELVRLMVAGLVHRI